MREDIVLQRLLIISPAKDQQTLKISQQMQKPLANVCFGPS